MAPVVTQLTTAGTVEVLDGIDLPSFNAVSGGFHYLSGGPFEGPYDMIIDDLEAGSKHRKVGDTVETLNHQFRICGIVEHGKGARKFVPIATLQDLIGAIGKASIFYVKLDDPNNADEVVRMIKSIPGMQQYGVHSLKEYLSLMTSASIPGLTTVIDVVIGIAMIIGFIVIFQAMYAAVMERTREIGILKSLGAGKLYIVNVVLRETLLIAIGGVILGIAISYGAQGRLAGQVPDAAGADHLRLAGEGGDHRAGRLTAGRVLSCDEGRAERSHRRAGVRIATISVAIKNAPPRLANAMERHAALVTGLHFELLAGGFGSGPTGAPTATASSLLLAVFATALAECFAEVFCCCGTSAGKH